MEYLEVHAEWEFVNAIKNMFEDKPETKEKYLQMMAGYQARSETYKDTIVLKDAIVKIGVELLYYITDESCDWNSPSKKPITFKEYKSTYENYCVQYSFTNLYWERHTLFAPSYGEHLDLKRVNLCLSCDRLAGKPPLSGMKKCCGLYHNRNRRRAYIVLGRGFKPDLNWKIVEPVHTGSPVRTRTPEPVHVRTRTPEPVRTPTPEPVRRPVTV